MNFWIRARLCSVRWLTSQRSSRIGNGLGYVNVSNSPSPSPKRSLKVSSGRGTFPLRTHAGSSRAMLPRADLRKSSRSRCAIRLVSAEVWRLAAASSQ